MIEIRELTKREQLEWELEFLLEQKEIINRYLESVELELK